MIDKIKFWLVVVMIFITNAICSFYYVSKYSGFGLIGVLLSLGTGFILLFSDSIIKNINSKQILIWLGFLCLVFLAIYFFQLFPKESNGNDKWSDIVAFWDKFLKGENGWAARSHLGNLISSMPLNLILAFPFYRLNIIDYFSLFGFVLVFYYLWTLALKSNNYTGVLLYLGSVVVFMEVASRSNLLLNGFIFLLVLNHLVSILDQKLSNQFYISAVFMGLAMSYRMAFAIPLIMILSYCFFSGKYTFIQCIIYGLIVTTVMVILFLPFVMGHWDSFMVEHPFRKQSKITPLQTVFMVVLAVISGKMVRKSKDLYFYTCLLVFVSISMGLRLYPRYTTLLYNAMIFPVGLYYLHLTRNHIGILNSKKNKDYS